ncbi:MAG: alpha/beta fold hydrolase [Nitrospinae bacterium]|nr:alpha/beta fold hydrolase [Nitrospinota bacterium]
MWAVSKPLTLWFVKHLFLVPPQRALTREDRVLLAEGARIEITALDRKLVGWKWGEGPLVVLVHGWGENAARYHRFIRPFVAAGYAVVAFDFPAHGESEGRFTNFLEFVKVLQTVIEHTGPPHAIIGYSMGGGAVVSMWKMFDEKTRMVLISSLYEVNETLTGFFDKSGVNPKLGREIFNGLVEYYNAKISLINPSEVAKHVRCEALVIHDEGDWTVPMEHAESLARAIPRARLFRTVGLSHFLTLDSEEVLAETLAFIKK